MPVGAPLKASSCSSSSSSSTVVVVAAAAAAAAAAAVAVVVAAAAAAAAAAVAAAVAVVVPVVSLVQADLPFSMSISPRALCALSFSEADRPPRGGNHRTRRRSGTIFWSVWASSRTFVSSTRVSMVPILRETPSSWRRRTLAVDIERTFFCEANVCQPFFYLLQKC